MTAINVAVPGRDAAYMLCDTVAYGEDGAVAAFGTKVATMPHAMAVCGARATEVTAMQVRQSLNQFASFDDIAQNVESTLRRVHAATVARNDPLYGRGFDVLVMGWSDRGRCAAALITSARESFVPTFEALLLAPVLEDAAWNGLNLSVGSFNPERDLLRIMEAQRCESTKFSPEHDYVGHVIGGAAVLTTLTRDKIEQRIIHRWNDKVGEKIVP